MVPRGGGWISCDIMPSPSREYQFWNPWTEMSTTSPYQGQAPIIYRTVIFYPKDKDSHPTFQWLHTFPRIITHHPQKGHPSHPVWSLGKPNKIWMELAQSNHCVLRKCPKIDPIMLILDKLNMLIYRHIFAHFRNQTNKIEERKIYGLYKMKYNR